MREPKRVLATACAVLAVGGLCACDILDRLRGDRESDGTGIGATADGLVLHETFDRPSGRWPTGPSAVIASGAYRFAPGPQPVIGTFPRSIRDGSARVRMRFTGGDQSRPAGLAVRHADLRNFICFMVDARGVFSLGQVVEGSYRAISNPESADAFVPSGDNVVELIWNGYRFYGMINGARVVTAYVDAIHPGAAGVYVSENTGVDIDELTIWDRGLVAPGVYGTVLSAGAPVPAAPVRLVVVTDLAVLEGRILDETVTGRDGAYSFRPPADAAYLVEANATAASGPAGHVLAGMRLIDLRLEPGGGRRDVDLVQLPARGGLR